MTFIKIPDRMEKGMPGLIRLMDVWSWPECPQETFGSHQRSLIFGPVQNIQKNFGPHRPIFLTPCAMTSEAPPPQSPGRDITATTATTQSLDHLSTTNLSLLSFFNLNNLYSTLKFKWPFFQETFLKPLINLSSPFLWSNSTSIFLFLSLVCKFLEDQYHGSFFSIFWLLIPWKVLN